MKLLLVICHEMTDKLLLMTNPIQGSPYPVPYYSLLVTQATSAPLLHGMPSINYGENPVTSGGMNTTEPEFKNIYFLSAWTHDLEI